MELAEKVEEGRGEKRERHTDRTNTPRTRLRLRLLRLRRRATSFSLPVHTYGITVVDCFLPLFLLSVSFSLCSAPSKDPAKEDGVTEQEGRKEGRKQRERALKMLYTCTVGRCTVCTRYSKSKYISQQSAAEKGRRKTVSKEREGEREREREKERERERPIRSDRGGGKSSGRADQNRASAS